MSPELGKGYWGFLLYLIKADLIRGMGHCGQRQVIRMARQSQNKFIKRQKELERMRKAKEKMSRRQSKKDKMVESDEPLTSDQSLETPNN
jgi:acyl carrier protein phosphodiesterase